MAGTDSNFDNTPEKIVRFCEKIGYPLETTKTQRIIGPIIGVPAPERGTEVYVANLPKHLADDELFSYFSKHGTIYKFRLMLNSNLSSRGTAFITFDSIYSANRSIYYFDNTEIVPGQKITVEKSKDNRRLFVGGIPDHVTKDQVWHQLRKEGMQGIVEVIMYKSYVDRNRNRGFVFVEFGSHQEAAEARFIYKDLMLFAQRTAIDWSSPQHDVTDETMEKVKILFIRNLNINHDRDVLVQQLRRVVKSIQTVVKVYKFRDYAFVHFKTRRDAQKAMWELKEYYNQLGSGVEIQWSKPPPTQNRSNSQERSSFNVVRPRNDVSIPCTCQCTEHHYIQNRRNSLEGYNVDNYIGTDLYSSSPISPNSSLSSLRNYNPTSRNNSNGYQLFSNSSAWPFSIQEDLNGFQLPNSSKNNFLSFNLNIPTSK